MTLPYPTKRCPVCKGRMHLMDISYWFCLRCDKV